MKAFVSHKRAFAAWHFYYFGGIDYDEALSKKTCVFSFVLGVMHGITVFDGSNSNDRENAFADAYSGTVVWLLLWLVLWCYCWLYSAIDEKCNFRNAANANSDWYGV